MRPVSASNPAIGVVVGKTQVVRLDRDQLVGIAGGERDADAALEVFWIAFEQRPSLDAYRRLIREADAADVGERWRADARALLQRLLVDAERTGTQPHVQHLSATIIEVLVFEGRVEDAWRAAAERDCDQRLWMQLARARESEHPEDAIPIYEREIEALIDKKNDTGYRDAVQLMVHVESLHVRLQRRDAFATFVERVRVTHGRKTNLMRRFDGKGW